MTFDDAFGDLEAIVLTRTMSSIGISRVGRGEIKAFFDFPLIPGGPTEFMIKSITDKGIELYNPTARRPAGH